MELRPYQKEAYDSTLDAFEEATSALVVMATGLGKTIVFAHLIDNYRKLGRVMVIAHREELIIQSKEKIDKICDTEADIEMGEFWAKQGGLFGTDVVVSTIQSQVAGRNGGRMTRFNPQDFSLLVIDEAHHAPAKSYKKVIEHYRQNTTLKVLGVTATPDRTDKLAMGELFEKVAYQYDIWDGITDGWLVPIQQQSVHVQGLDYSSVRTTAGDLNGKDLSAILEFEENLHGFADPIIKETGSKKTLVFCASVVQGERVTEILNRHKPNSARFVCGTTPSQIRRDMFKDYAEGKFQYLVNVNIATEGWDGPDVQVVADCFPTKSRSRHVQKIGRGTRPLTGLVDPFEDAIERREAIENSNKPFLTVLDFVGNTGRHKLVTPVDVLGGKYSDDVIELAKENVEKAGKPTDIATELQKAEREIAHRYKMEEEAKVRQRIKIKAKYKVSSSNPFDVLDISPQQNSPGQKDRQPTPKQLDYLNKYGLNTDGLSYLQCRQLVLQVNERWKTGKCTYKQARWLQKSGFSVDLTFAQAKPVVDAIAKNHWRPLPEHQKAELLEKIGKESA